MEEYGDFTMLVDQGQWYCFFFSQLVMLLYLSYSSVMHGCHTLITPKPSSFVSFETLIFKISYLIFDPIVKSLVSFQCNHIVNHIANLCVSYDKLYHVSINTYQKISKLIVWKIPLCSGKPFVDPNC